MGAASCQVLSFIDAVCFGQPRRLQSSHEPLYVFVAVHEGFFVQLEKLRLV